MAEQQGAGVAKELGCTDPATMVACLRSKSASTLLPLSDYGFGPVYGGGGLLPLSPKEALSTGKFNRVPVLNGSTRDEYRMFAAAFEELGRPPMTAADYLSQVDTFTGSNAAAVLARYPLSAYGSPSEAWSALVTDAVFSRSQSDVSQDLSARVPTYSYEFADRNAPWVNGLPKPSFPTGAFHVAELAYLFQTQYVTDPSFTPAQQQLSDTMIQYWTTFARFGNPNSLGAPCWPRSNGTVAQVLAPDAVALVNFATEHNYSFWQTVFP
jgi:para-nitrobenzyl esterase